MKNGVGAFWPFLCDHERKLLRQLELADESDPRFRPSVDELRIDLRAIMSQRPDWEYSKDWQAGRVKYM
jgi:hypothetical protein